eukprot:6197123-Pleurochrysis_carterae.AAC.1
MPSPLNATPSRPAISLHIPRSTPVEKGGHAHKARRDKASSPRRSRASPQMFGLVPGNARP